MLGDGIGSARFALLGPLLISLGGAACGPRPRSHVGISVPYEISTLDPHAKDTLSHVAALSHFYEPLVTTDAELKLEPCLAQLWENPDPSTWIFHLQPGVSFHSGRPLTARDVASTLKRLASADRLELASYLLYINDIAVLDPLTLRLRTERPLSNLLSKLRFVPILPEGVSAEDLEGRVDGTGPFTLVEWKKGERLRMVRNERYWRGRPALESVDLFLGRDADQAARDLISGRSQIAQINSRRAEATVRAAGREIARRPGLFVKYLAYDMDREVTPFVSGHPNPFRDKRVRQALDLGVDRRRLVDALSTGAVPASQLVPPSIFGFNPALKPRDPDPGRARELLRLAGLPDGFDVTLHVRRIFAEAAEQVRDQLAAVGVRLTLHTQSDPEFLASIERREHSLLLARFGCPTGDASDILDTVFHTPDPARHMGTNNYGGYANASLDQAIEDSAGIEGLPARRAALESIMGRLMEDLPWIPLYIDEDVYGLEPGVVWRPRSDSFILAAEISRRN